MMVWIEVDSTKLLPIRIFKSRNAAFHLLSKKQANHIMEMDRSLAVKVIRKQIVLRANGFCEMCGSALTEMSGHMHEQWHRGRGGEISLENSLFICPKCHQRQHRDRNPKFTRRNQ